MKYLYSVATGPIIYPFETKERSEEILQGCKEYVAERILQDSYGMKKIILKLILNG